ncbi:MAG: helix-turn-helix domain-containing protein, partial [Planctomycetota bacterium]
MGIVKAEILGADGGRELSTTSPEARLPLVTCRTSESGEEEGRTDMPRLDPKKREEAYSLRLQGKSFAEIARTLHMSPKTVRRLEYGWVDK